MRISNQSILILTASAVVGSTYASSDSKTPVAIRVKDGKVDNIEGFDDPFTYSLKGNTAGIDTEVGVNVNLDLTSASLDGITMPYSFWGTVGRKIGGWNLSARSDVDLEDIKSAGFDASSSNEEWDTSIRILASTDGVNNVEMKQGISLFGGDSKILINPKYDLKASKGDVEIGYYASDTGTAIKVEANAEKQKLIVSQQITDTDRIAPSITADGKFSFQWQKSLTSDGDSVTTTISPNDSISLKWQDGPWTANFRTPFNGFEIGELDVSISRKVPFL
uniref:Uncharacterized protein n=1 Tax=Eucampia antarctica TaxID=49252 RepID=A0A7S2SA22_9STRA|eukprot:CAMPEP_0197837450 /NCGR_PEP_ID=MMETSP1437-20131217/32179_1 /TAXON_ID=49252 ORGANISM="Eucampia antarctica, Strain CCMP1452" /NCGR_SAMPLE_ID=MMETSP1437 /ASSEMBLY_ACC=CAM_ASM_001096 /LENGTH=277 /DNA_ID=CAMNT_0043444497 /DNA_START=41 /DNA_END=874 /DNA_ORIENTATION=+